MIEHAGPPTPGGGGGGAGGATAPPHIFAKYTYFFNKQLRFAPALKVA